MHSGFDEMLAVQKEAGGLALAFSSYAFLLGYDKTACAETAWALMKTKLQNFGLYLNTYVASPPLCCNDFITVRAYREESYPL